MQKEASWLSRCESYVLVLRGLEREGGGARANWRCTWLRIQLALCLDSNWRFAWNTCVYSFHAHECVWSCVDCVLVYMYVCTHIFVREWVCVRVRVRVWMYACNIYIHIYIYVCAYMHAYAHCQGYAIPHTLAGEDHLTSKTSCVHICVCVWEREREKERRWITKQGLVCTYVCVCVCKCVSVIICVYMYVFIHTYIRVHTFTYTHTHTHKNIHIHTYIDIYTLSFMRTCEHTSTHTSMPMCKETISERHHIWAQLPSCFSLFVGSVNSRNHTPYITLRSLHAKEPYIHAREPCDAGLFLLNRRLLFRTWWRWCMWGGYD